MDSLATTAATLTIPTLLYMYANAKLHLHKDLRVLLGQAHIRRALARAVRADRVSPYYFIADHAARLGSDKEAIWARDYASGRTMTYSWTELLERANQFAWWFLGRGVKRGDLVGFYMLNSAEFVSAWVGLWAVGAAPAMVNYHLRGDALVHCLRISGARLVLVDGDAEAEKRIEEVSGEMRNNMKGERGMEFVRLADIRREVRAMKTDMPPHELRKGIKGTEPMALFYTSGTTGMPKGCAIPVAGGFGQGHGRVTGMNPVDPDRDRFYVCMPFYHGTGGISAIGQILAGNTICIAPKFSVSNFWSDIRDSRATWFVYVGETLRYLLAAPPSPLDRQHHVRAVFGNGLRPDVWQRFRDRFGVECVYEFFNSTEGMLSLENISRNDYTAHAVGHHGLLRRWKYHQIYVPVAVDAETGDLVRDPQTGFAYRMPYEVGGEILVRIPSEGPFPGYWGDPGATKNKFVQDVFEKGDCFYRTGDALRRDSEGRWFFLDRLGDTFRWKGENVSTAEVSEVLGKFTGVLDANVYGVQLPGHDGKAGTAAIYIDPALKESFNHQDFLRHASTHLPRYAVPLFLRHVQAPFRTHNNKQNKIPLKREGVDPDKVSAGDRIFWIEGYGKGCTYVPFTRQDWEDLHIGKAKL